MRDIPDAPSSDVAFTPAVKAAQSARGSREGYAKLEAKGGFRTALAEPLLSMLAEARSLVLATASAEGQPYVQHRGGAPGFVRVLDRATLGFADYAGNRQYVTTGNLSENDRVQLLLIDYARRRRIKVWGTARVVEDDPDLLARLSDADGPAAERAVVIEVAAWDVNCPQHIPQRFEAGDVAGALAERDDRIAALEAELRALRGEAWSKEGCAGAGDD